MLESSMGLRKIRTISETQKKRAYVRRMLVVHGFLMVGLLIIVARLMDLQLFRQLEYGSMAEQQHFGSIRLPAKRGDILTVNSRTGDTSILATNTTLDLVYVDPLIVDEPAKIAELLSDTLVTDDVHRSCSQALPECPTELRSFYGEAFNPLAVLERVSSSGALLEPLPVGAEAQSTVNLKIPDITEIRRLFARSIENRIAEKRITFTPLKYGANKEQMRAVSELQISGVTVNQEQSLIWADPEVVDQGRLGTISRALAPILDQDSLVIENSLRSRPLRYVPVMRRIPPAMSLKIKEAQLESLKQTSAKRAALSNPKDAEKVTDPLRSIALIPEHWRYYPDSTLASQLVGFLNRNQDAQYGIERTFDAELRGQEGEISTVSDPTGGQIVTSEQTIRAAKDGDTVVLTIDPFIQKFVEEKLAETVKTTNAEHAQVIVMDPKTGRVLAMANAPLFDRSDYGDVFEKETMVMTPEQEAQIVIEIIDPETNLRVMQGAVRDVFDPAGRALLSEKLRQELDALEKLHDLHDLARYYVYRGETTRYEVFPTSMPHVWLKYANNIGVGAYINRTIQEIYEPGSVMKSVTMAIGLDQGEITPLSTYVDSGAVIRNDFPIDNNDKKHYGRVTMTNCLEFSINTCMVDISERLGRKLFHSALDRFGFGQVTGVELEDETTGDLAPWRNWSDAQLATTSFGQGIAVTPLQMIASYTPLANKGLLMKPMIVDRIEHADGTVEKHEPVVVDQVITPDTADTITAMLVSSAELGFAKNGRPAGYTVAGKTGTSQIAGPGGKYESGTGATIASYVGYGPVTDPKFIILVKIDRATYKSIVQGAVAAAPLFKEVASFLFQYYGIPPDNVH